MKERLPVVIENLELPIDEFKKEEVNTNSYGYVSILYIISLLITIGSVLTILIVSIKR